MTLQGRFQILCLSGSYLVAEDGGPRNRTGGVSVSLSSPDGHVIGGGVAMLMAASPVQVSSFHSCLPFFDLAETCFPGSKCRILVGFLQQVVVCSFVHGNTKAKNKQVADPKSDESSEPRHSDKLATPTSAPPGQSYTPSASGLWPGSRSVDLRTPHTGIDLTRG